MSPLTSLKKNLDESAHEVVREVELLVELEEKVAFQLSKVNALKKHRTKLQRALDILEGNESEPSVIADGSPLPAPPSPKQSAEAPTLPKPPYTGPRCSACQGRMYPHTTKAPSGVYINHLRCDDCGNEAY